MLKTGVTSGDLGPGTTSRRRFVVGAGMTALGLLGRPAWAALSGASAEEDEDKALTLTVNDINVLNFALNIEYLGAEFHLRAALGRGLSNNDVVGTGTLGSVRGGSRVSFQSRSMGDFAREIALDEEAHVRFLRATLGANAVARPAIDLGQSFTKAARLAGLISPRQTFNPFADEDSYWLAAFMLEDVDVTAYGGSARLLTDRTILDAAAGILAVEAYHAGGIRTILNMMGQSTAARAISDLRDAADGPGDRDQPIRLQGRANIVPTDVNGLAFGRTPAQVLSIVYLGGAASGFGFFPNRINGAIR
jgi:Ferritin-like domain